MIVIQLSIVNGTIGWSEIAPLSVELVQELIHELSLSRRPMEEPALDSLQKSKSARIKNAQVNNFLVLWSEICLFFNSE